MINNQRKNNMKYLKNPLTTLFFIVLCYGVTVPDMKPVVKDTTKTVKKEK
jgi:hypothetical protein